jgi:hypothetical protein
MASNTVGIPQGTNYREDAFNALNQKYIDSSAWADEAKVMLDGFIVSINACIDGLSFDDVLAEFTTLIGTNGSGFFVPTTFDMTFTTLLQAAFTADLAGNTLGTIPAWEQAMYDRAVARQELDLERTYNDAVLQFSSKGWDAPPGAAVAKITEIDKEQDKTRVDLQNAILVQSGTLQQQFAVAIRELGVKLNDSLIKLNTETNAQGLQGALGVRDLMLKKMDAAMNNATRIFIAELEALRGNAQIAAQIVAAALNGVNVSASFGFQGGVGVNYSNDMTKDVISESIQLQVYYDQSGSELPPSVK